MAFRMTPAAEIYHLRADVERGLDLGQGRRSNALFGVEYDEACRTILRRPPAAQAPWMTLKRMDATPSYERGVDGIHGGSCAAFATPRATLQGFRAGLCRLGVIRVDWTHST